jgi:tRNA 2-thiouridine synthesizing protein E
MANRRKPAKTRPRKAAPKAKAKIARKAKARVARKAKPKARPATMRKARTRTTVPSAPQPAARPAPRTIFDILHPGAAAASDPNFRDAPEHWTPAHARTVAAAAGLKLTDDHWEVIRVLQGCYKDEFLPRIRLLRDALEARFVAKGGMKYLFAILPGGPIAQGCTLAGLKPPHGARDLSFGSVA